MIKKIFIAVGIVLAGLVVFAFIPPYWYLPEKVFVEDALKYAKLALQKFTKEKELDIRDFKLTEIRRGCCDEGYDYYVVYCHPKWEFVYDSYLSSSGGVPLKKGEPCDIDSASQYSPYLGSHYKDLQKQKN